MPERRSRTLSLDGPDGAEVYVLEFRGTVDFGAADVPQSLPFAWVKGPFANARGGLVTLSPGAAAVLQPFSEEGRWERLHAALRKKYVQTSRTIVPDSVLTLTEGEMLGAAASG